MYWGLAEAYVPPDAVGEFKVMTLNPPAEFGQSGLRDQPNFSLKMKQTSFMARFTVLPQRCVGWRGFFASKTPINKQNEFGATAGGPSTKDKTFFFGWFHGFRLRKQPGANSRDTIPTDAMKAGDLSNIIGAQVARMSLAGGLKWNNDPATTRTVAAGALDPTTGYVNTSQADAILRDAFGFNNVTGLPIPGQANVIPANRIDPVTPKTSFVFPSPAPCSTCQFGYRDNSIGQYFAKNTINDWGAKIDHAFSSKNRIMGEFSWFEEL